jgi:hypothetical protein
MEAPNGFEPMIWQLQCRALPLGYGAKPLYYNRLSNKKSTVFITDLFRALTKRTQELALHN